MASVCEMGGAGRVSGYEGEIRGKIFVHGGAASRGTHVLQLLDRAQGARLRRAEAPAAGGRTPAAPAAGTLASEQFLEHPPSKDRNVTPFACHERPLFSRCGPRPALCARCSPDCAGSRKMRPAPSLCRARVETERRVTAAAAVRASFGSLAGCLFDVPPELRLKIFDR